MYLHPDRLISNLFTNEIPRSTIKAFVFGCATPIYSLSRTSKLNHMTIKVQYRQNHYQTKPSFKSLDVNPHAATSISFMLSDKVSKFLSNPNLSTNLKAYERLLNEFRTNVQDDMVFHETIAMFDNQKEVGGERLSLTTDSLIIAIDTGGETDPTDFGICIYDRQKNSVYKIHIEILEMPQSKRSKNIDNLMAYPVRLTRRECIRFLKCFHSYYFGYQYKEARKGILLVGHNLEKDLKSLNLLKFFVPNHIFKIDTDHLCRQVNFDVTNGSKLKKLAAQLGVLETKPFHPSVNDAYYTIHVLLRLISSQTFSNLEYRQLVQKYREYNSRLIKKLIRYFILTKTDSQRLIQIDNKTVDDLESFFTRNSVFLNRDEIKSILRKINRKKQNDLMSTSTTKILRAT